MHDEPDIRLLIELLLSQEGYRVETAGSGEDALDQIHHRMRDRFGIHHITFQLEREAMYQREGHT